MKQGLSICSIIRHADRRSRAIGKPWSHPQVRNSFPLRAASLILVLLILLCQLPAGTAHAEPLQDCHKVTNTYTDTTRSNKAQIRLWQVETALPAVTEEINGIASGWVEELGNFLPDAKNSGKKNSRLDVEIRYSRTGLRWMSFLVQARTTFHQDLTAQRIASRTYDMISGQRIMLSDLFNDTAAWSFLAARVRESLTAYWPDVKPDEEKLNALCQQTALEEAEFTLHGMSLVLHYPADLLYPDKHTLMEVTVFYPEIRDMLAPEAAEQTDNLAYYKTCALTFDDGPSSENTPKVLISLMQTGARGTFFAIGNRVDDYRYLVRREHDNGHAVASHNWHHGNATKSSAAALRRMPEKVNTAMIKAIGIPVRYDRVPGGRYPPMVKAKVKWAYIQWSLDTYDWRGRSADEVLNTVKSQIDDGDIILCHDIKKNTGEATRKVVQYLEENGYMCLTIDELFAKDGVAFENGKVYYRCKNGDYSIKKTK